jgi:hypothetical protein
MSYQLRPQVFFDYLAVGAQALGTVPAQQVLLIGQQALQGIGLATSNTTLAPVQVPGGESPSQANFNTAIDTLAANLKTAVALNLAQLQGFSTGGG